MIGNYLDPRGVEPGSDPQDKGEITSPLMGSYWTLAENCAAVVHAAEHAAIRERVQQESRAGRGPRVVPMSGWRMRLDS